MTSQPTHRDFDFRDQAVGPEAEWRLVVVAEASEALGYGFMEESAARHGASSYIGQPGVRAVWVEPVEKAR